MLCPITQELMQCPVIGSDGYTYEQSAIEEWLQSHGHSPMTRQPMHVADLRPNRAVADQIQWYKDGHTSGGSGHGTDYAPSAPPLPSGMFETPIASTAAQPPPPRQPRHTPPPNPRFDHGHHQQNHQQPHPQPTPVPAPLQHAREQHQRRKKKNRDGKLVAGRVYGNKVEVTGVYQDKLREKDCTIM